MPAPANPFRDTRPFQLLRLGGRLFRCVLHAVNGVVIEDEWNVQKPTGSSGAVAVFKGTKIAEEITMELRAYNALQYDELHDLCELLKPAPGFSGSGSTTAAPVTTPSGFTAAASTGPTAPSTSSASSSSSTTSSASTSGSGSSSSSTTPNPGPRPPTLLVENAFFAAGGVFAVSRKKVQDWEWDRGANFWSRKVTVIQAKPPTPAGVGAQATPKPGAPGSQFSGGAASQPGPSADAAQAKTDATRSPV